jgi:hypothetical protein
MTEQQSIIPSFMEEEISKLQKEPEYQKFTFIETKDVEHYRFVIKERSEIAWIKNFMKEKSFSIINVDVIFSKNDDTIENDKKNDECILTLIFRDEQEAKKRKDITFLLNIVDPKDDKLYSKFLS